VVVVGAVVVVGIVVVVVGVVVGVVVVGIVVGVDVAGVEEGVEVGGLVVGMSADVAGCRGAVAGVCKTPLSSGANTDGIAAAVTNFLFNQSELVTNSPEA